jgi:hypothetical protein
LSGSLAAAAFMVGYARALCPVASTGSEIAENSLGISTAVTADVNNDGHADWLVGTTTFESGGSTHPGHVSVFFGGAASDGVADVILTGETNGDRFGYIVAPAEDLNSDGHADIIVGAYQNDANGSDSGRAYVYYGGPSFDSAVDLILTGEAPGDNFGVAVDGVGDVNGDGFDDVLVGARFHNAAGFQGRAYVYFGGPNVDSQADLVLDSQSIAERFGFTVSSGGDLNDDGHADFMVGAYHNSEADSTESGRLYVYFGGPSVDTTPDLVIDGEGFVAHFSDGLDAADVNGDGDHDILVGASQASQQSGRAYVFFGGPTLDTTADLVLEGSNPGDWFGRFVSGGGDLDGDGFNDLAVGAPGLSAGTPGRVYVYSGGPTIDSVPHLVLDGEALGDHFGWHGALGHQDVTGDGAPDLAVGAWGNSVGGSNLGRAYAFSGGLALDRIADVVVTGEPVAIENLGISVSIVGDVNADGFPDYMSGATSYEATADNHPGHVLIYFGGPGFDAVADLRLSGENDGDRFGYRCAPAGDVNGDGYRDIVVGAYQNDAAGPNSGRAYIHFGGPALDVLSDLVLTGELAGDEFGIDVAGIGDVNDDGHDDILVGARFNAAGGQEAGRAYVYFGGPTLDDTADLTLNAHEAGERFGFTVSGGDVNGDGTSDFAVGAYLTNNEVGRVYVYYGGATLDANPDLILDGEAPGDHFSAGLATADVNGDGHNDILVGASQKFTRAGRAYVYFGGPLIDVGPDLVFTEGGTGDWFGRSVSGGADLDGDGHTDLLIGAPAVHSGGPGRVYIYRGGPDVDGVVDAIVDGESAGDMFGWDVSVTAEDVDGDGEDDYLIGGWKNDAGGPNAGRIDLYLCRPQFILPPEPGILSTLDVGNDDGRQVRIRFERSSRDDVGSPTPVLQYETYRRIDPLPSKASGKRPPANHRVERARAGGMRSDPGILLAGWDFLGIVPAHGEPEYNVIVPTLADSTKAHGIHWSVFFVRAATVDPLTFFDSAPDSGYSTDDVPPQTPADFRIASVAGNGDVELSWSPNPEADFMYNTLYRGSTSDFEPGEASMVTHIAVGTSYLDEGAAQLGSPLHYKLSSTDEAGNESGFATVQLTATDTEKDPDMPSSFAMHLGTPNPVREKAVLGYDIPRDALVRLVVYDARGRLVRELLNRPHRPGRYVTVWHGRNARGSRVAPGVYFYRLETADFTHTLKIVMI